MNDGPSGGPGPHPALVEVAAGRPLPALREPTALLQSAFAHGMAGVLLPAVRSTQQPWRSRALTLLTVKQATARAHRARLVEGLSAVTAILDDMGVDVALAKGLAAETRWYDFPGQRPMNDLDLVLCPSQLDRLDDIVAALEPDHPLLGRVSALAAAESLQAIDLVHDGVPIDLHWDLFKLGVRSRNLDLVWDRTVQLDLADGQSVRALDAETSFVHFLLHLNKDRFRRLLGFVDVTRIHDREDLDLAVVARLARQDGIEISLALTWDVVTGTLGRPATRPVAVPRGPGTALRTATWHRAWRPEIRLRAGEAETRFRRRQWLIPLLARGRIRETASAWLRSTVPPADLLAYAHSAYATRWGGDPTTRAHRGRLWLLTIGRVRAALTRRRRVTLVRAGAAQRAQDGDREHPVESVGGGSRAVS